MDAFEQAGEAMLLVQDGQQQIAIELATLGKRLKARLIGWFGRNGAKLPTSNMRLR